jgi:hypothetical protein
VSSKLQPIDKKPGKVGLRRNVIAGNGMGVIEEDTED